MRFSIIMPTYNRKKLLADCINSIYSQNYPSKQYELIIVDDGSTDGTDKIVKSLKNKYSNLRYFKQKNQGQAVARNFGLRKAKGRFIAFTDDDCVVEKNWLRKIEDAFERTNADAVGGSIANPTNKYIAWAQYILNFSSWFPKGKERYVKDIPTANIAYKREAIKNMYFRSNFGSWGYTDSLFNHDLYKQGKKILFNPNIEVKHYNWQENYGFKKFFDIQKKAALGFLAGGYNVHGKLGKILFRFRFLNLFCPRIINIFVRCLRKGYFIKFIVHSPLILLGESYRNYLITLKDKGQ